MSRPAVRQKRELSVSPTNAMVEGHSNRASGERPACCPAVQAPGESASLLASASIIVPGGQSAAEQRGPGTQESRSEPWLMTR
jgi:hypothetical protein